MIAKPSADEGFMTTEEVLEYLQVNLRTVYRLITEASAIETVNLGVTGYLVKPFKANEVLAVIARALSATTA